jgi:Papain family cysteine protease
LSLKAPSPAAQPPNRSSRGHRLDARPDTLDFRDRMYEATLVEVPPRRPLATFRKAGVPILDQGTEGACTGFGLATVVNYLLQMPAILDDTLVSPRMLYEMAKRYDEWPGEKYEGSSARGAMKGWHKHGVCSEKLWAYKKKADSELTAERSKDAIRHPLGAYYRVNHRDLICMHSAITEVGILYATSQVHAGWDNVGSDGLIKFSTKITGGHAFAIVGYDEKGFWIQNSWGEDWGKDGYCHIGYDDWLINGTDVWVARLGVPVESQSWIGTASLASTAAGNPVSYTQDELRPHVISIGNNGLLRDDGPFGSTRQSVQEIFDTYFPALTNSWTTKRLLLFAHGGLVTEDSAIQRLAENRATLLAHQIYPISFVWKSDFWTTIANILRDALSRRTTGGVLDSAKDFMLDRLDDALEPLGRVLTGKAEWDEMKENALAATTASAGGARIALGHIAAAVAADPSMELHLVGHSAGAIFHAPLVQLLTSRGNIKTGALKGVQGFGLPIKTCTLWAPACTVDLFKATYMPAIAAGAIKDFGLFTLKDQIEQDDNCANIYHKSLLYLVSNAFEARFRIPLIRPDGEPIFGMEKFIRKEPAVSSLFTSSNAEWILTPNNEPRGSRRESNARHHGDFDNDDATLRATLTRMLGQKTGAAGPQLTKHLEGANSIQRKLSGIAAASSMQVVRS